MQLLVFEWVTGGGALDGPVPTASLLHEGQAMWQALVADILAEYPGHSVLSLRDARLPSSAELAQSVEVPVHSARELGEKFDQLVRGSDATMIIAPEIGDQLAHWARRAEAAGARLISPGLEFIEAVGNKRLLAARMTTAGVPCIPGELWTISEPWPAAVEFPAIVKPVRGAGCYGVRLCADASSALAAARDHFADALEGDGALESNVMLSQSFYTGLAASIAAIGDGGGRYELLPPCEQLIQHHPVRDWAELTYHGSRVLESPTLAARARELGRRVLAAFPPARGYVGIDLVLDNRATGTELANGDRVVEINARLTSSYLELRRCVPSLARLIVEGCK